jgi:hypothetical protein
MELRSLVVAVLLAGCAAPGDGNGLAVPEDWDECRWVHPDGEVLACQGDATALEPTVRAAKVVCSSAVDFPNGRVVISYSPIDDESVVQFEVNQSRAFSGIVAFDTDGEIEAFNWSRQPSGTQFALGKSFRQADFVSFIIYESTLETEDPRLQGAQLREAWSWHANQPHAVRHATTASGHFLFYNLTKTITGDASGASSFRMEADGFATVFGIKIFLSGVTSALSPTSCLP